VILALFNAVHLGLVFGLKRLLIYHGAVVHGGATDGTIKILSFRSRDPVFKADPGVVPDDEVCAKAGITVVRTEFQHNELSDRGPDHVKNSIQDKLHQFLDDADSAPDAMQTNKPTVAEPEEVAVSAWVKN
jgi:hypothetical protein